MLDPDTSDDVELERLFGELAQALLVLMDTKDADILTRTELHGQTLSELATHLGCSRTEANRRLNLAQRSLSRLMVQSLASLKSE